MKKNFTNLFLAICLIVGASLFTGCFVRSEGQERHHSRHYYERHHERAPEGHSELRVDVRPN